MNRLSLICAHRIAPVRTFMQIWNLVFRCLCYIRPKQMCLISFVISRSVHPQYAMIFLVTFSLTHQDVKEHLIHIYFYTTGHFSCQMLHEQIMVQSIRHTMLQDTYLKHVSLSTSLNLHIVYLRSERFCQFSISSPGFCLSSFKSGEPLELRHSFFFIGNSAQVRK